VSLINDALRKARQAAAEHDARPPDGPFQARKAYPSRSPNRRTGVMLVVLVAMAAGLLGAALAWWLAVDHQPQPMTEDALQQRQVETQPVAKTPDDPVDTENRDAAPRTAQSDGQELEPGESGRQPEPDARANSSVEPAEPPAATEDSPADTSQALPTARQTPEPNAANESGGERIFVLDADVGYATLNLGFIVSRSTNPFAEINGIEVRIGSEIENFTVEAIEADRVILRDDKGTLILRVP
jgi:cytoskeletal protein RodZ